MRGRIPDEIIEQVRTQVDILEIIQKHVKLKRSGKNYFGLCPFHAEKSPSFSVSPDKQIYHCFGCKAGGDAIQFIMEIEKMSFYEAIIYLTEQLGIQLPEYTRDIQDEEDETKQQMRQALELAAKMFHYVLKSTKFGRKARHYLTNRQIQMQTIDEFQIGYAPNSFDFLLSFLKKRGYDERLLQTAGLISSKEKSSHTYFFDRFRDRVMFPIHDSAGRVIGFGGRLLGERGPKYLNSPETPLFHKGRFLFNFHRARSSIRRKQRAIVFEGYMDVLAAWQSGLTDTVATLGTALTDQQAKVLSRNTEQVVLCYDSDQAGQTASEKGAELLRERDCIVKIAQMPHGYDPDDYIKQYGGAAFRQEIVDQSHSFTAFQLESLKKHYQLQDEDQRMRYLTEALKVISELPQAIERDHYLRKLATEFQISLEALKTELRKVHKQKKRVHEKDRFQTPPNPPTHNRGEVSVTEKAERWLIAHMMKSRSVTAWVREHVGANFYSEIYAALAAYLYTYYDQEGDEDVNVSKFIHMLEDQSLRSMASELAMLELPEEIGEQTLLDCADQIRMGLLKDQIAEKTKLLAKIAQSDPIQAATITREIVELRKQLKKQHKPILK